MPSSKTRQHRHHDTKQNPFPQLPPHPPPTRTVLRKCEMNSHAQSQYPDNPVEQTGNIDQHTQRPVHDPAPGNTRGRAITARGFPCQSRQAHHPVTTCRHTPRRNTIDAPQPQIAGSPERGHRTDPDTTPTLTTGHPRHAREPGQRPEPPDRAEVPGPRPPRPPPGQVPPRQGTRP